METLAVLEILGRQGMVVRTERIGKFPCTLGRAYDNDVIVCDPYLAAHHIRIESDEKGFKAIDLGTKNGMYTVSNKTRLGEVGLDRDTVLRLGHTQIRFRSINYTVSPEQIVSPDRMLFNPLLFIFNFMVVLFFICLQDYLSLTQAPDFKQLGAIDAVLLGILLVWITTWSMTGRLLRGKGLFFLHGSIACIGFILYELTGRLVSLVAFAFSWPTVAKFSFLLPSLVLGLIVYRHISLISRSSIVARIIPTFLIMFLLLTGEWVFDQFENQKKEWNAIEQYVELWPSSMLVVQGKSVEQFFLQAENLKQKAEAKRNDSN